MAVHIHEWSSSIRLDDLGPLLNKRSINSWITPILSGSPPPLYTQPVPSNLQGYIDLYGEQVTHDAVDDIQKYFQTIGGPSTQMTLFPTPPVYARPSITAISVIGEGLAGWYLENKGLEPFGRPIGEPADLVFQDINTSPRKYALVQVKATATQQQASTIRRMRTAAPSLLQYTLNNIPIRNIPNRPFVYSCYIIGVIINKSDNYDIMSLEVNLV